MDNDVKNGKGCTGSSTVSYFYGELQMRRYSHVHFADYFHYYKPN